MDIIIDALNQHKPLSVVSVGATETFVMAQYTVLSEEEFMNHPEATVANRKEQYGFFHRGVTFPNCQLRDEVVEAVRRADVIGYNTLIRFADAGPLSETVFKTYGITPKYIYDSYLRRVVMFSQKDRFEAMLQNRRLLLIGEPAGRAKSAIESELKKKLHIQVVEAIPIRGYEDVPAVKEQIDAADFDLCLLAAGTNALILSSYIAQTHRKVAFDIGFSMNSFCTHEIYSDQWLENIIGLDELMKM